MSIYEVIRTRGEEGIASEERKKQRREAFVEKECSWFRPARECRSQGE